MKSFVPYSLLLAAAASGVALGQTTAYTTPVGYVSLGNATSPAVPAETDYFISLPLDKATEAAVLVGSIASDVITLQGSPNLGALTGGVPYVAKISSGTKEGLVGLITSNTGSSLTLQVMPGEDLSGVVSGDKIVIQKAWTPQGISAGNNLPAGTQLLAFSGTAPGINVVNDITYEFDGTSWLDLTTFAPADDAVLYQGEALILRTIADSPVASLVLSGQVPVAKSRSIISNLDSGGQDNFVSFTAPIGNRLDLAGLGFNIGDQILLFDDLETNGVSVTPGQNKSAVKTLEYQGGGAWLDLATFANAESSFYLPAGASFVYRVAAGATLADTIWSVQPTYVSSL